MNILIKKGNVWGEKVDVVVVGQFEASKREHPLLEAIAKEEGFKPKLGETMMVRTAGELPARRVLVVGLGDKKKFDDEAARVAAAAALDAVKAIGAKTVLCELFGSAKAMAEGIRLADYAYGKYKSEVQKKSPKAFDLMTDDGRVWRSAAEQLKRGELSARATVFARDLVNAPAAHMRPIDLVETAKAIAKGKGSIRVRVFNRDQLDKMGAGGILGIAQGSDHEPFLVHMTYKSNKTYKSNFKLKRIALVGKAVTFDSGGLSLKPANSMETMKCDMAGAAAVLGVFSVIDELAPAAEVHGIFGAVENMPSGKAIRPGDVVKIMNGKTIEIRNTDAEGRVTLADTLTYATKQKPDAIIDLATLTGACVVALGEEYTGLMTNNPALGQKVLMAAAAAGENMWELPLPEQYKELIKSDIADYKNDAPRWGGTLTAGLLLQEFVSGLPWAHLDIAGPAFNERPVNAYLKKGGTGHGVRTLLEYLRSV
jgi:leucyl aminopeptidase